MKILLLLLMLGGCGFHLRHYAQPLHQYPLMALPFSGSHSFHQALHRHLASCVKLVEKGEHIPTLLVVKETLSQQPLVYGPDGELRREQLNMSVTFSLTTDKTQEFELRSERARQLNSKQRLGDDAEKVLIEQEMQTDIIQQLLRFLNEN